MLSPVLAGETLSPGAVAFDASGRLWIVETQGAVRVAVRGEAAEGVGESAAWELLDVPSFSVGRGAPISARFVPGPDGEATLLVTDALRGVLALNPRTGAVSLAAAAYEGPADERDGLETVPFHHLSASYYYDQAERLDGIEKRGAAQGEPGAALAPASADVSIAPSAAVSASASVGGSAGGVGGGGAFRAPTLIVSDLGSTPPSVRDEAQFSESDSLLLAALRGGLEGTVSAVRVGGDVSATAPVASLAAEGLRAPSSIFVVDVPSAAGPGRGAASSPYLYAASATSAALLRAPLASLAALAADETLPGRERANLSSQAYETVAPLPGVAGAAVRDPATGEHWVALRAPRSLLERAVAAGSLARYALAWLSRIAGTARLDGWGALLRIDADGTPRGIVADRDGRQVWGLRALAIAPPDHDLFAAVGPSSNVVYVGSLAKLRERADWAVQGAEERDESIESIESIDEATAPADDKSPTHRDTATIAPKDPTTVEAAQDEPHETREEL